MKKNKNILFSFFLIVSGICFITGCRSYEIETPETVFKNILAKCTSTDTNQIYRLDSLIDFEWERMIVIEPYSAELTLKNCGYSIKLDHSKISSTEGSNEYIFILNNKLIKHVIHEPEEKKYIRLLLQEQSFPGGKNGSCGVPNTPETYIRFLGDSSNAFNGKTFLVFRK